MLIKLKLKAIKTVLKSKANIDKDTIKIYQKLVYNSIIVVKDAISIN